jgi:hypothetical protein
LSSLSGSLQFSVQNTDQRFARVGRLSVQPGPGAQASWLSFKEAPSTNPGQFELEFEKGATRTVTLLVNVPPDAAHGNCLFTIQIASENDPDNDFAQSSAVSFTIPERQQVAPPPSRKVPWWAIAAGAGFLVVAGGGAWWAFSGEEMVAVPSVRGTEVASAVKLLNDAGLLPVVALAASSNPPTTVIATDPAEGKSVPKNSRVAVTVAIPPNTPDPCNRRELSAVISLLCNRRPINLSVLRNATELNAAVDAIKANP